MTYSCALEEKNTPPFLISMVKSHDLTIVKDGGFDAQLAHHQVILCTQKVGMGKEADQSQMSSKEDFTFNLVWLDLALISLCS